MTYTIVPSASAGATGQRKELIDPNSDGYTTILTGDAASVIIDVSAYPDADWFEGKFYVVPRPLATDAAGVQWVVRPNGLTTNLRGGSITYATASAPASFLGNDNKWFGGTALDGSHNCGGNFKLDAKTGRGERRIEVNYSLENFSAWIARRFDGGWSDTSTALTSIDFVPSTGQFAAGSWWQVWAVYA